MHDRDAVGLSALRSALAALDNAGAVPPDSHRHPAVATHAALAGTVIGVGAAEVAPRLLTDDEERAVVQAEIDERLAAAAEFGGGGRHDRAERLRAEARVLANCLHP
jgi:uncharacterized protein